MKLLALLKSSPSIWLSANHASRLLLALQRIFVSSAPRGRPLQKRSGIRIQFHLNFNFNPRPLNQLSLERILRQMQQNTWSVSM